VVVVLIATVSPVHSASDEEVVQLDENYSGSELHQIPYVEKLSHLKRAQSEVQQSEMQQEILKLKQKDIAEELVHSRDEEAKEKVIEAAKIEAAKNNEAANQLALEKAGEENHVKQSQSSELNNLKQDTVGKDEAAEAKVAEAEAAAMINKVEGQVKAVEESKAAQAAALEKEVLNAQKAGDSVTDQLHNQVENEYATFEAEKGKAAARIETLTVKTKMEKQELQQEKSLLAQQVSALKQESSAESSEDVQTEAALAETMNQLSAMKASFATEKASMDQAKAQIQEETKIGADLEAKLKDADTRADSLDKKTQKLEDDAAISVAKVRLSNVDENQKAIVHTELASLEQKVETDKATIAGDEKSVAGAKAEHEAAMDAATAESKAVQDALEAVKTQLDAEKVTEQNEATLEQKAEEERLAKQKKAHEDDLAKFHAYGNQTLNVSYPRLDALHKMATEARRAEKEHFAAIVQAKNGEIKNLTEALAAQKKSDEGKLAALKEELKSTFAEQEKVRQEELALAKADFTKKFEELKSDAALLSDKLKADIAIQKENATHVDLQKIMSQKKQIEDINSNKSTSIAKIQDTANANIKKINSDVDAKIAKVKQNVVTALTAVRKRDLSYGQDAAFLAEINGNVTSANEARDSTMAKRKKTMQKLLVLKGQMQSLKATGHEGEKAVLAHDLDELIRFGRPRIRFAMSEAATNLEDVNTKLKSLQLANSDLRASIRAAQHRVTTSSTKADTLAGSIKSVTDDTMNMAKMLKSTEAAFEATKTKALTVIAEIENNGGKLPKGLDGVPAEAAPSAEAATPAATTPATEDAATATGPKLGDIEPSLFLGNAKWAWGKNN